MEMEREKWKEAKIENVKNGRKQNWKMENENSKKAKMENRIVFLGKTKMEKMKKWKEK